MPSFVPVTALYHFNQFGAFQPYVGGGVGGGVLVPDEGRVDTGVKVDPTVGLVLQGGADVMIDQHWGWTFDVKKVFAHVTSHGTGDNLAALGGHTRTSSQGSEHAEDLFPAVGAVDRRHLWLNGPLESRYGRVPIPELRKVLACRVSLHMGEQFLDINRPAPVLIKS